MRMLVFPNVESVATDPFVRTGEGPRDWDAARFDPAYFRRFEDRIIRLGELGIEADVILRSEEHTSELQSLMRISYAVFCLKKKQQQHYIKRTHSNTNDTHPTNTTTTTP